MKVTIHGIKACDTMKKAFTWLDAAGIAYTFVDYKKEGAAMASLRRWCAAVGWKPLVNTRGTTWRKLSVEEQQIHNDADAIRLMNANPSVIKRPVLELEDGRLLVGFDPTNWSATLEGKTHE